MMNLRGFTRIPLISLPISSTIKWKVNSSFYVKFTQVSPNQFLNTFAPIIVRHSTTNRIAAEKKNKDEERVCWFLIVSND